MRPLTLWHLSTYWLKRFETTCKNNNHPLDSRAGAGQRTVQRTGWAATPHWLRVTDTVGWRHSWRPSSTPQLPEETGIPILGCDARPLLSSTSVSLLSLLRLSQASAFKYELRAQSMCQALQQQVSSATGGKTEIIELACFPPT